MRFLRQNSVPVLLMAIIALVVIGCGVSEKKLNAADQRIEVLAKSGVPDSMLSDAKVLLSESRTSKKLGNGSLAKSKYDAAIASLAKSQNSYGATTTQLKPAVESLRKTIMDKKLTLTGIHLHEADSLVAILDKSISANDWQAASDFARMIDTVITSLQKNEMTAKELLPKIAGSWSSTEIIKDKEAGANAVEKKLFVFGKDGNLQISEERSGQTNETFKEDWKFESSGTYSLKGDTIYMKISKEKCLKQVYQTLKVTGKKKEWIKAVKPTYDSTITNGAKDRYIAFEELKAKFKKK